MINPFTIATRDELWLGGVRVESRLAHGRAIHDGATIVADDTPDDALVARVTERMPALRAIVRELGDARVRILCEAGSEGESSTITVTLAGVSIVTTPTDAIDDVTNLRNLLALKPATRNAQPATPYLWRNGSASVLLHEAIGHAAEHDHDAIEWPSWLHVDAPLRLRRATFRDVPLLRMTALVASQANAPYALPDDATEIHLVAGGAYEPLTETVTLDIAVATRRGERIAPFTLRATRREIAQSLVGASGEPLRYPGVICSREGQELVVGSFAPLMVTR
jgi:hypothetical protein